MGKRGHGPPAAWSVGQGGFGADTTSDARVRTRCETPEIWLRRTFELASPNLASPHWRIHHHGDVELYLNGTLVGELPGSTNGYAMPALGPQAIAALRAGTNTLAVHVRQAGGGGYIDSGLHEVVER